MDPISVSASILALLGAATKVSQVLTGFVGSVKDAPRLAQTVITEIEDMKQCLQQLQEYVVSESSHRTSRKAMVMVDQLRVVLTNAVMTFSALEDAVEALKFRPYASLGNRLRWVTKESTISKLLQRLQSSKLSLNLVLTTLTCADTAKAQQSIDTLTGRVHDLLATNQEICHRLEQSNHPTQLKHLSAPSALESGNHTDDDESILRANRDTWCSDQTIVPGRSFEQDLHRSRVYKRISRTGGRRSDPELLSLPSSNAPSMGFSFLSGLSLADVSNISLISLPISSRSLSNSQRYSEPLLFGQASAYFPKDFRSVPRSSGKIALLGISNAGKSTVLKQLQIMQGIKPTEVELEEARHVIRTGLIDMFGRVLLDCEAFNFRLEFEEALDLLSQYSGVLHVNQKDEMPLSEYGERKLYLKRALNALCHLWEQEDIKRAINSRTWPEGLNNFPYIMDNLFDIFRRAPSESQLAYLIAHIMTNGVYKSNVTVDPFDFKVYDVGGTRAGRKKWGHCLGENLDFIIHVVDLNGYCQHLQEDHDTNQMMESLLVFDSVVNNASVHDVPIFLLLNKADLFEQNISQKPIADYFADYSAGAEYSEACRFFAGRFASLDHRPRGKLYCYVTDSLHTTKFRNAWRQVQEKMIYTTLKY